MPHSNSTKLIQNFYKMPMTIRTTALLMRQQYGSIMEGFIQEAKPSTLKPVKEIFFAGRTVREVDGKKVLHFKVIPKDRRFKKEG